MANANTTLKKHFSLIKEMEKASQTDKVKNPVLATKTAAAAKKVRIESRISELEQQRAAFNKKMDEAIAREKTQLVEIERFEQMVPDQEIKNTVVKPNRTTTRSTKVSAKDTLKATTNTKTVSTTAKTTRTTKK
ncbi:hypothetical protein [Vibrio sp. YIC-376]|uniref:hypothetical protein n=1 Tax=Vibrio sp. YIC-376 TaxID=3136162 RepID=UPI00402ADD1E